jgi:hypothetical protein
MRIVEWVNLQEQLQSSSTRLVRQSVHAFG